MGFFDIIKKESNFQKNSEQDKEISTAIIKEISESGYIKLEILPELTERIKKSIYSEDYSETGFSALFSQNDCLTLEEKKQLGYPTRQKISREMINSLSSDGLKLTDPKGILQGIYNHHYSIISKKYELIKMKKELLSYDNSFLGYKIIAAQDFGACIICGSFDGTLLKTIKDIENYEKHKCLNNTCRCTFIPIQKGFEKSSGTTYAGWFRTLSAKEKKEILGEYYDQYKAGKSLKDIALFITEDNPKKDNNTL